MAALYHLLSTPETSITITSTNPNTPNSRIRKTNKVVAAASTTVRNGTGTAATKMITRI